MEAQNQQNLQQPLQEGATVSVGQSAQPINIDWESFVFLFETESLFVGRDAVIGLLSSGMKKRISVISPESLLPILLDPLYSDLSSELFAKYKGLQQIAIAGLNAVPTTNGTAMPSPQPGSQQAIEQVPNLQNPSPIQQPLQAQQQQQQQQQPQIHTPDSTIGQEPLGLKRIALAKLVPGEVWSKLLNARIIADKATALRARGAVITPVIPEDEGMKAETTAPKSISRKKKTVPKAATKLQTDSGSLAGDEGPAQPLSPKPMSQSGTLNVLSQSTSGSNSSEDGRRTASQTKRAVSMSIANASSGKKKRKGSDFSGEDDAPNGCPDMMYLLDGFPALMEQVEEMSDNGISIGAVIALTLPPTLRRSQGQDASLQSRQRGVSRQQPPTKPARKRKGGDDKQQEEHESKSAETPATFSQFYTDLKANIRQSSGIIWLEINDGDPTDPYDSVHKLTAKLYDLFSLRQQYNSWIKTSTGNGGTGENIALTNRFKGVISGIPQDVISPEILLSCISESEATNMLTTPTTVMEGSDEDAMDAEIERQLSKYADDTLRWLLSEETPEQQKAEVPKLATTMNELPSLVVLRFGDEKSIKAHGHSERVREVIDKSMTATGSFTKIPGRNRYQMPEVPEKSALEQANDLAELTQLLSGTGVFAPPLSVSEVDRTLTLLEFEEMLAGSNGGDQVPKFDDRVIVEHFDPDVFAQVFASALEERPNVRSHYFVDQDSMLVCMESGNIATTTEKQDHWKSHVQAKTTFKQWLETNKSAPPLSSIVPVSARPHSGIDKPTKQVSEKIQTLQSKPPSVVTYNIDQSKIGFEKNTNTLFLADGCTLAVSKLESPTRVFGSARLSIPGPLPATFVLHSTKTGKRQQQQVSLTATFQQDSSSAWIGEQHGVKSLSYARLDGRVLVFGVNQTVELFSAATAQKERGSDIKDDPLSIFEHDTFGTTSDDEISRRVFLHGKDTGVCRFLASGATFVMFSTGETESFDPETGVLQHVNSKGELTITRSDGSKEKKVIGTAMTSDPESGFVIITREDMVMTAKSPAGEMQARFPDGTTIRSTIDGSSFVETPNLAVVQRCGDELSVALPDGTEARCSPSGISFVKACCVKIRVQGEIACVGSLLQPEIQEAVRPGEYRFDLVKGGLLSPEYDHQRFAVSPDFGIEKQGTESQENSPVVSPFVSHPPRLFRIAEDGSATEYLNMGQLGPYLTAMQSLKPRATIANQPVHGDQAVESIACIRQLTPFVSPVQSDLFMPKVVAWEDPDYVQRSISSQPPQQVVAVVRQLLRHRQLKEEQMNTFLDTLDRFHERRKRETPVSLSSWTQYDPRSVEEKEAQAKLQEKLCRMLQDETEEAKLAKECSQNQSKPNQNAPSQVTTAINNNGQQTSVTSSSTSSQKPVKPRLQQEKLNYFNSEEAAEFLRQQEQSPQQPRKQSQAPTKQKAIQQQEINLPSVKPQKQAKPGTPPAVGLMIPTTEDREASPFPLAQPKSTQQQQQQQQQQKGKGMPHPDQSFAVFPQALSYGTLEIGYAHQLEISLTNMTFESARFIVKKLSEVSLLRLSYPRGPVAPGMTVKILVELAAQKTGRYADEICIAVGDDVTVRVVVTADVISHDDFSKLPNTQSQRRWRSKKIPLPPSQQQMPTTGTTKPIPPQPTTQFPPLKK